MATFIVADLAAAVALWARGGKPLYLRGQKRSAEIAASPFALNESWSLRPTYPDYPGKEGAIRNCSYENFSSVYEPWNGIYRPRANVDSHISCRDRETNEIHWTMSVKTDEHGRRLDPNQKSNSVVQTHLLALGTSPTWGHGLNDDQTFLAKFSQLNPRIRVYNAAADALGVSEQFVRATESDLFDDISPKQGMGVYVLNDIALSWFIPQWRDVAIWRHHSVILQETENGNFRKLGAFSSLFPFKLKMAQILVNDPIVRLFDLNWPSIGQEDADRFARLFLQIRQKYRDKTSPDNPFILVFLRQSPWRQMLRNAATKAEIPFLDYMTRSSDSITQGTYRLPSGDHMSPEFTRALGETLSQDLNAAWLKLRTTPSKRD